nr:hypothetical protein [Candidatus Sigynarchaeota archaeon]
MTNRKINDFTYDIGKELTIYMEKNKNAPDHRVITNLRVRLLNFFIKVKGEDYFFTKELQALNSGDPEVLFNLIRRITTAFSFPVYQDIIPYRKYEKMINQYFRDRIKRLAPLLYGINHVLPLRIFWLAVKEEWDGNEDKHSFVANFLTDDVNFEISCSEKHIDKVTSALYLKWKNYLSEVFFMPNFERLSLDFFKKLSDIGEIGENLVALYEMSLRGGNTDLLAMVHNPSLDIIDFSSQIERAYAHEYNIFERLAMMIATEIGKIENKCYKKITDFFIINDEKGKPGLRAGNLYLISPDGKSINTILWHIIHVKNGFVSHELYKFSPDRTKIIMKDEDPQHRPTYEQAFTKAELYNLFYDLGLLTSGFKRLGQFFIFLKIQIKGQQQNRAQRRKK